MALVSTAELNALEYLKLLFGEGDVSNNINEKKNRLQSFPSSPRLHDWSDLPRDISTLIAEKLRFFPHLQKFGTGCKEWRNIANEIIKLRSNKIKIKSEEPPLLLLPYNQETQIATFLEIKNSKMYPVKMPELKDQWICGASNGWLAMTDDDLDLFLFNPVTRACIKLPPLDPRTIKMFCAEYHPISRWARTILISRVVLSGDPSSDNCLVAIIYSQFSRIGVCRLGDENWSVTGPDVNYLLSVLQDWRVTGPDVNWRERYGDVIFYQGKIFTATKNERVHVFDYSKETGLSFSRSLIPSGRCALGEQRKKHLVESCGQLLLVYRFGKVKKFDGTFRKPFRPPKTWKFEVFKLKEDMESLERVYSLGGRALFLGPNDTISVSAKEFSWCKPDCIYFTDDTQDFGGRNGYQWDNGVYSLKENRVIEKFDIQHSLSYWPAPALWFGTDGLRV